MKFNHVQRTLILLFILLLSRVGLSAMQAEKAARVKAIFDSLKEHPPDGKGPHKNSTIRITEDELNAYVDQEYRAKPHSGMKSASVKLDEGDRVWADSIVNIEDLKTDNSMALKMLSLMFSGDQTLHVEAHLIFNRNTVTYELERAQLNNITLPNLLVRKLIEILARRQSQKIDVTKPIPLSPAIKHIEIRKGLLIIQV